MHLSAYAVLRCCDTLCAQVSAGVVGKNIASGGATPPPELLAVGAAATLSVMGFLGKVAQQELAKLSKDGGDAGTSLNGGAELPK